MLIQKRQRDNGKESRVVSTKVEVSLSNRSAAFALMSQSSAAPNGEYKVIKFSSGFRGQ